MLQVNEMQKTEQNTAETDTDRGRWITCVGGCGQGEEGGDWMNPSDKEALRALVRCHLSAKRECATTPAPVI